MSAGECCDWEPAGSELQSWQGLEDWVAIRLHLHCSALSTAAPPNFCSRVCSPESPAFSPSPWAGSRSSVACARIPSHHAS